MSLMLTSSSPPSLGLRYDVSSQLNLKRIQNHLQGNGAILVVADGGGEEMHRVPESWRSCG